MATASWERAGLTFFEYTLWVLNLDTPFCPSGAETRTVKADGWQIEHWLQIG